MQKHVAYADAIVTKYPEQIVIAIARDAAGKHNPITLGWSMVASGKPAMMAVAIARGHHSTGAFRHSRQFVLAFPSEVQAEAAMFFGTHSGAKVDKLAAFPVATQPASQIDGVLLSDAVANFECRLAGEMEAGDHVIFVGEVVCSHVNPDRPNRLYTVAPGHRLAGIAPQ